MTNADQDTVKTVVTILTSIGLGLIGYLIKTQVQQMATDLKSVVTTINEHATKIAVHDIRITSLESRLHSRKTDID